MGIRESISAAMMLGSSARWGASFTTGGTEILSVSREAGHADRDPRKIGAIFEAFVWQICQDLLTDPCWLGSQLQML